MGVITNGSGGGGGNVRYNPANDMVEIKYNGTWTPWKQAYMTFDGTLYDNGDFAVPWDNNGYVRRSDWVCDGGANILTNNFTFTAPSTDNHSRVIITDDVIDVTNYTGINIEYNGTIYSSDITSVSGNCYIYVECIRQSSYNYLLVGFATQKAYYAEHSPHDFVVTNSSGQSSVKQPITKIWLSA